MHLSPPLGILGCCPFLGGGSVVVDFLFIVTLLYVHSSIAIILMGKRELIALLNLSSWCLVMVELPFLVVPRGCLRFVIVVFPDHTHFLFLKHQCKEPTALEMPIHHWWGLQFPMIGFVL